MGYLVVIYLPSSSIRRIDLRPSSPKLFGGLTLDIIAVIGLILAIVALLVMVV